MEGRSAAPGKRWKNVAIVRERDEWRVRRLWTWLLAMVAAFAPVAIYLVQQMDYVHLQYRVEDLRGELRALEEEERLLRVERASLEALPRVEKQARRELGLIDPEHVVVITPRTPADRGLVAEGRDGSGQP